MEIMATRGGERKTFTREVWANMPADKYGWKVEAQEPEEVRRLREEKEQTPAQFDPIFFALQGDGARFDEKYLPELQRLGLAPAIAQTIASSVWGSLNDLAGVHHSEINKLQETISALHADLQASNTKVTELTAVIESFEQGKAADQSNADDAAGAGNKVSEPNGTSGTNTPPATDPPAPPKKPVSGKK